MRNRYLVSILLVAILIFGLIGCSGAGQQVNASQKTIDQIKSVIENDAVYHGNKVTKVTTSKDGQTLYVAFDASYANQLADLANGKQKLFEYIQGIAKTGIVLNIDIRETDISGSNQHCYTSAANMVKIKNNTMTYDDWVKVAF